MLIRLLIVGIRLASGSRPEPYSLESSPWPRDKATDKAYCIDQDKNVMVYRLITRGTFEERINAMLKEKKELADLTVSTDEKWGG